MIKRIKNIKIYTSGYFNSLKILRIDNLNQCLFLHLKNASFKYYMNDLFCMFFVRYFSEIWNTFSLNLRFSIR